MKRIIFCIALLFGACGGGGGDSNVDVAGVWRGELNTSQNNCPANLVDNISGLIRVNQDNKNIVADIEGFFPYAGNTVADGFVVTRTDIETCLDRNGNGVAGTQVETVRTIEFYNVVGDTASVRYFFHPQTCSDSRYLSNCTKTYGGIFQRDSEN